MAMHSSLMLCNSEMMETNKEHEPTCLPGRRPAPPCQVAAVVLGGHDGCLQILIPDACRPVPNGQEVLGVEGIPYQAVHWTMVTCQSNTVVTGFANCAVSGAAVVSDSCSMLTGNWFYML